MSERIAPTRTPEFEARLKKRYASERRFRALGLGAIVFSVAVLVFLLGTMTFNGIGGFQRVEMEVPIDFTEAGIAADPAAMEQPGALASLEAQGLRDVVQYFAEEELGEAAAEELGAQAWRDVATAIIADPAVLQRSESFWLPASANLASGYEGEGSPEMQALAAGLYEEGRLAKNFDPGFLGRSDATNPQQVGIWGALKGSLLTMVVTLLLAFPIGVLAALYLEEYAPKNRWTDLIELSINNLAAVPSIIFGLLGLAVFLTLFPNLRSAPLIGGMTLALMTMPVIVIAGRNAIKAVPPSIRDGALAIGASPVQVVFHHVLPLALPGILTGTIIGLAQALGETAPLLLIGMVGFVASNYPEGIAEGFLSPNSAMPAQIYEWAKRADPAYYERAWGGIIILLVFLMTMNIIAIILRRRFERRW